MDSLELNHVQYGTFRHQHYGKIACRFRNNNWRQSRWHHHGQWPQHLSKHHLKQLSDGYGAQSPRYDDEWEQDRDPLTTLKPNDFHGLSDGRSSPRLQLRGYSALNDGSLSSQRLSRFHWSNNFLPAKREYRSNDRLNEPQSEWKSNQIGSVAERWHYDGLWRGKYGRNNHRNEDIEARYQLWPVEYLLRMKKRKYSYT